MLKRWIVGGALLTGALALTLVSLKVASASGNDGGWRIRKSQWSETDERAFAGFVQGLGRSGCNTVQQCLSGPANPYRGSDPRGMTYRSDCAELPYFLRAYFAWKNGLPFGYVSEVEAAPSAGGSHDIRYSPEGNRPTARYDILTRSSGAFPSGTAMLAKLRSDANSAMYRYDPRLNGARLFTDFYPVKISRDSIKAGTIIYDPNGHVAMVYDVLDDGRVLYMDAHPDNSLTHGTFGMKFARSRPGMGAGFKRFRPITLQGAASDAQGDLIGGRIVGTLNENLPDYSTEQFFGTEPDPDGAWQRGKFVFQDQTLDFYDYVRHALAIGDLRYHPVEELKNMVNALCQDIRDRVDAVRTATSQGIDHQTHPERLPNNIYGTEGDWETYSSPSRDARLKTSFKEMRDRAQDFVEKVQAGDSSVVYDGSDIKTDLLQAFETQAHACTITYGGNGVSLDLEQVMGRLFKLSFDPYSCVERRWGATDPSELASCADDDVKARWYEGEQRLRNQIDRTYDTQMGFTVDQLFTDVPGNGVETAPDVDVKAYLMPR